MVFIVLLALCVLPETFGIVENTEIKLKSKELEKYLWFGFEAGGTVNTTVILDVDKTIKLGYYLCTVEESKEIKNEFNDNFCEEHGAGEYTGCSYHTTIPWYLTEDLLRDPLFVRYVSDNGFSVESLTELQLHTLREGFLLQFNLMPGANWNDIYIEIYEHGIYEFFVVHCESGSTEVDLEYTVMNPGGEHLSVGILETKLVMDVAKIIWIVVFGL